MEVCNTPITTALSVSSNLHIGIGVTLCLFVPLGIISNGMVILSFYCTQQATSTSTNMLIILLSICDCLNAMITMPLFAYLHFSYEVNKNCLLQQIITVVSTFFSYSSGAIVVSIAVDRYLHMNPYPGTWTTRLKKIFQRPWIYHFIANILVMSVATSIILPFVHKSGKIGEAIANLTLMVICFVGMSIITTMYTRGYLRLRRITFENTVYANQTSPTVEPAHLRSLQRTVLILLVAMFFSYAPFSLACSLQAIFFLSKIAKGQEAVAIFTAISILAIYSNCITNSVIILSKNRKAKEFLHTKFCKWIGRESRPPTVVTTINLTASKNTDLDCKASKDDKYASCRSLQSARLTPLP